MSHSVGVTMISDQQIKIFGKLVNVHDITTIFVNNEGVITDFLPRTEFADQQSKILHGNCIKAT